MNAPARLVAQPAEFVPECTPTYTLDREIERAKAEMGPEKWARLNAEWEAKP